MPRSTRLQNKIKQLIYRPGKSRFLSKAATGKITDIDKTIKSSFNGLLEGMGFVVNEDEDDKKDSGENTEEGGKE